MNASFPPRFGRSGMVLIELLMALFVFTCIAFALVKALSASFDAASDRNQIDAAVRGLNNHLVLLHSGRVIPGESDAPDDGSGILYHISCAQEVLQDQKNVQLPNMYRVTITATWKGPNGDSQDHAVSELIFQP